jgi:hypothetical protein
MTTHSVPSRSPRRRETDSGAFFKVAAVLLGFLVAVLGFFALLMWADARESGNATDGAVAAADQAASHSATAGSQAADHSSQRLTPPRMPSFRRCPRAISSR